MFKYWEHTEVEVIDFVTEHLLKQCKQSISDGLCMYRHPDGLMCAAGCLIPKGGYTANMENKSWALVVHAGWVPSTHSKLIQKLQLIHDNIPPSSWSEKLAELRSKYSERNSNE
jgi:hypothetical protein